MGTFLVKGKLDSTYRWSSDMEQLFNSCEREETEEKVTLYKTTKSGSKVIVAEWERGSEFVVMHSTLDSGNGSFTPEPVVFFKEDTEGNLRVKFNDKYVGELTE